MLEMIRTRIKQKSGKKEVDNMAKTVLTKPEVTVDFPQKNEAVTSPCYTIRITAKEATRVEVSIDDSPWQPCRCSVGHWWHDWSGYMPGSHQIQARGYSDGGRVVTSLPRRFIARRNTANNN